MTIWKLERHPLTLKSCSNNIAHFINFTTLKIKSLKKWTIWVCQWQLLPRSNTMLNMKRLLVRVANNWFALIRNKKKLIAVKSKIKWGKIKSLTKSTLVILRRKFLKLVNYIKYMKFLWLWKFCSISLRTSTTQWISQINCGIQIKSLKKT